MMGNSLFWLLLYQCMLDFYTTQYNVNIVEKSIHPGLTRNVYYYISLTNWEQGPTLTAFGLYLHCVCSDDEI